MKIGFIGLGTMGRGMAANLQKAGHELVVNDLSRQIASQHLENGAIWAATPRDVAEACDVVFTSLPTPPDVEAVGAGEQGLGAGFRKGAAWFDLSTNSVDVVRRLHGTLAERGVAFLDAPVSGGPSGAASGKLAIWVGGEQAVFDRYQGVLDAMADQARYIGPIGAGTIAKLVHNMASTAIKAVLAEVLTMGVKAGLEALPLWEAIRSGAAGRMRSFDNVGRLLQGKLDPPSFALRLVQKDIALALQLGRESAVPMRLCNLVQQDITEAMNRGWGGRDSQSFLVLQQERAGVPPFALTAEQMSDVMERSCSVQGAVMLGGAVVETTDGRLRGLVGGGVHVFKGVRYGASTGGSNRYMPPQPVERWPGIRDAVRWGASAPQSPVAENKDPFFSWYSAIQEVSEDCLFLNVFTPALGGAKRPVMFWIHGGGWREFSGTAPGFDGTALAHSQDVVVVTVNHRLNGFGYLRLEDSGERFADSGNAGLLDLVMALGWVRDNVAGFGGDPANVTLFGESGGASKIAAILGMRAAAGLFHKAIIQSSAGGLRLASRDAAAGQAVRLADALGWDKLDGDALQKLPMQRLLDAQKIAGGTFRGMIDGRSFDTDPFDASAPAISADVPVMAGCTNTETTYYLRADPRNFALEHADVRRRLIRFLGIEVAAADAVIEAYRAVYPEEGPSGILVMVTSDYVFKRNTFRMASLMAAAGRAPVYAYVFDRSTPVEGGRLRSPHTSEVPFIFGTAGTAAAHVGSGDDITPMTERMMACWASFARSGDPNNRTVPHWVPFKEPGRQTMILNVASRLVADPGGKARAELQDLPYFGYAHSIAAFVND